MNLDKLLHNLEFASFYGNGRLDKIYFGSKKYYVSIQVGLSHCSLPYTKCDLEEYTHFEIITNIPSEDIPKKWKATFRSSLDNRLYNFVPRKDLESFLVDMRKKYSSNYIF